MKKFLEGEYIKIAAFLMLFVSFLSFLLSGLLLYLVISLYSIPIILGQTLKERKKSYYLSYLGSIILQGLILAYTYINIQDLNETYKIMLYLFIGIWILFIILLIRLYIYSHYKKQNLKNI
jgi:hypothetical protein